MTTVAAVSVKSESINDLAGELKELKIPKATPVFRTYVMSNSPSITETDWFRPKFEWIIDFVQRSSNNVERTSKKYGKRACSWESTLNMFKQLYPEKMWYSPGC